TAGWRGPRTAAARSTASRPTRRSTTTGTAGPARAGCRTSCSASTVTTRRWAPEPRSPMTTSPRCLMLCATLVLLGGLAMATSRAAMQPTSRRADTPQTGFLFESIAVDGRTYDYAIYVPRGYDPAKQWPVVMFLHGMGESG